MQYTHTLPPLSYFHDLFLSPFGNLPSPYHESCLVCLSSLSLDNYRHTGQTCWVCVSGPAKRRRREREREISNKQMQLYSLQKSKVGLPQSWALAQTHRISVPPRPPPLFLTFCPYVLCTTILQVGIARKVHPQALNTRPVRPLRALSKRVCERERIRKERERSYLGSKTHTHTEEEARLQFTLASHQCVLCVCARRTHIECVADGRRRRRRRRRLHTQHSACGSSKLLLLLLLHRVGLTRVESAHTHTQGERECSSGRLEEGDPQKGTGLRRRRRRRPLWRRRDTERVLLSSSRAQGHTL